MVEAPSEAAPLEAAQEVVEVRPGEVVVVAMPAASAAVFWVGWEAMARESRVSRTWSLQYAQAVPRCPKCRRILGKTCSQPPQPLRLFLPL